MPTVSETLSFIKLAHKGQTDKLGVPYYLHPMGVADILTTRGGDVEEVQAALLHDVIEDTDHTAEDLLAMGYTERTVRIVQLVSRTDRSQTYMEFIQTIADSGEVGAIKVKLADLQHNTLPERMEGLAPAVRESLTKRYDKAKAVLRAALKGKA